MNKKRKIVELSKPESLLEAEIIRIVNNVLKTKEIEMDEFEVKKIIRETLPDIDRLIANKVKQHFYELGSFLVEKFKL
jgi:hypothetical protein